MKPWFTPAFITALIASCAVALAQFPPTPTPPSGGGAGAATAANQALQITQETASATALGTPGNTAACSSGASSNLIQCQYAIYAAVQNGIGATGSAAPADAIYLGGSSGGNLTGLVICNAHAFAHITSATDTLLVQGIASESVKICGVLYHFAGTAAQVVYIENTASANANCSSTKTQITGAATGNSTAPSTDGFYNSTWGGLVNTSGNGVCINTSGTGNVDVDIWFTQGS
jgi:hypothetical protein